MDDNGISAKDAINYLYGKIKESHSTSKKSGLKNG
jgi:hypothetical protein